MKTLSLIIPAYNEARHLSACLDAISLQTEMPDEVIVVDNNSSDKTSEIAKKYPFVKVIKERRQGVIYARNTGFDAATSDIIGRIDADTVLPRYWVYSVKNFYRVPSHKNHAYTGGSYFYNIRFGRFFGWCMGQVAFRMNRLLLGHYITYGSNMALPRGVWRQVRDEVCFDPNIHEDLDLSIHLHRAGYEITYHEYFRVGVKMRRVRSQHGELWGNLMWWPRTLRRHGRWTWVFGWIGAVIIYILSPIGPAMELLARVFGKKPLVE